MSIESVRRKFQWDCEAQGALHELEVAIASFFAMESGFRTFSKDTNLRLEAEKGGELTATIAEACRALAMCHYNTRHPRSLAHMVPPPATISILGDLLKGAINQCAFTWKQGPLVPALEAAVLSWLARTLGFSSETGGLFTSGGTSSNYIANFLALSRMKARHRQDRLCLIASDQCHFSIHKAAQLTGVGNAGLFLAPTGRDGRLRQGELNLTVNRALEGGYQPYLFVCTAGTTNAGVLEPIDDFAIAASRCSAWLHIDGAHGAFAALGAERYHHADYWCGADSVSWDPHKTLFVSYPAGALVVRDRASLEPLQCQADYAFQTAAANDPAFGHLEGSRGFDALKVWLTIKHIGRDGFATLTDYLLDLARYFAIRVSQTETLELVTSPDTNIVCFRAVNQSATPAQINELNTAIQEELYLKGETLLSRTTIGRRVVLRAVLQNPFTTKDDIEQLLIDVGRAAQQLRAVPRASPDRYPERAPEGALP